MLGLSFDTKSNVSIFAMVFECQNIICLLCRPTSLALQSTVEWLTVFAHAGAGAISFFLLTVEANTPFSHEENRKVVKSLLLFVYIHN